MVGWVRDRDRVSGSRVGGSGSMVLGGASDGDGTGVGAAPVVIGWRTCEQRLAVP